MLRSAAILAALAVNAAYSTLGVDPMVPEAGSWSTFAIGVVLVAQRQLFRK